MHSPPSYAELDEQMNLTQRHQCRRHLWRWLVFHYTFTSRHCLTMIVAFNIKPIDLNPNFKRHDLSIKVAFTLQTTFNPHAPLFFSLIYINQKLARLYIICMFSALVYDNFPILVSTIFKKEPFLICLDPMRLRSRCLSYLRRHAIITFKDTPPYYPQPTRSYIFKKRTFEFVLNDCYWLESFFPTFNHGLSMKRLQVFNQRKHIVLLILLQSRSSSAVSYCLTSDRKKKTLPSAHHKHQAPLANDPLRACFTLKICRYLPPHLNV
jgi:hypothetical protein